MFKKGGNFKLKVYIYVDWVGSRVDGRSTMGYCTFLGGNIVTWRSKKQPMVTCFSAKVEFRVIVQGRCELLWLKIILSNLQVRVKMLYCDNKAAINRTQISIQHDQTKHVEIDRYFIKEKLDSRQVCPPYVSSSNQLADVLTKGLSNANFQ